MLSCKIQICCWQMCGAELAEAPVPQGQFKAGKARNSGSAWARCDQAHMQRTELLAAELDGAELGRALRVTSGQAEEANTDETTVLLADFA